MRIRTITTTYSRKYNLGNYESLELDAMIVGDLDEDEDPSNAQAEAFMRCIDAVHTQAIELGAVKDSPPVNVQSYFMNKPVKPAADDYDGACSQRRDGDVNGLGFNLDDDPF